MKNKLINGTPYISDITLDTHFDFKLDGWPASVALITLCLSEVLIYGIRALNLPGSLLAYKFKYVIGFCAFWLSFKRAIDLYK